MAGDASTETAVDRGTRTARFGWFDGSLVALAVASVCVTLASALVQVSFGTYSMSIPEAWRALFDPAILLDPRRLLYFFFGEWVMRLLTGYGGEVDALLDGLAVGTTVVWTLRLPRVLVGALVGASLAVSGAIFQAVTRNELASPYILGVSAGAGLGALVALVLFTALEAVLPLVAAGGGAFAFLLVYVIAWKNGTNPVRLVLAGVIVSTVFHSLQTGLFFLASDIGVVQQALSWTTGSLTGVGWEQFRTALPWVVVALALALVGARQLNVLLLGERTAAALGMSVERTRFALAAVAVLAASAAVAVAGIVSFVGLIVPHVVRTIVGSDYKRLVVGCVFAGPALLTAADVGARLFFEVAFNSPVQIPVGIVTGLVGGPYFLYLMRTRDQLGEL
ncbi:FecCD family ABC transporter permease [Halomarina halobia]|uniref:FecCD family ABC transporter permease n=1 Tax=Halomarina halobia TaxID=3033386 RepID=A0ABD6AAG7_9EURY|nr:iron ABC transporter permease [Halomarina sp. PSR21]